MNKPYEGKKISGQWTQKAEHDLKNAEHTLKMGGDCPFDTVCFHAQQCVEKYLKALLSLYGIDFPKTHDLTELHALLPKDINLDIDIADIAELNPYAVETRYPGESEPETRADATKALEIARAVRKAVRSLLR